MGALEQGAQDDRLDAEATQIYQTLLQIGGDKVITRALIIALSEVLRAVGPDPELIASQLRTMGMG